MNHTDNIQTLESYLTGSGVAPEDASLISALGSAGAELVDSLRSGVRGNSPTLRNSTGDLVRDADLLANNLFISALARQSTCGGALTEETHVPVSFDNERAARFVMLDPLDGSANMDSHGVTGTIFGVVPWAGSAEASSRLPGKELVLSGYILYSTATIFVLAEATRVNIFVLDSERREFLLSEPDVRCPESGATYSLNEANVARWPASTRDWLTQLKSGKLHGRKYSQRYCGALVADAHRALLTGGIFAYPGDAAAPKGKLRLQYEVNPMSFLFRAAGGHATTGTESPLDIVPEQYHDRSSLILGSREEVQSFERALRRETDDRRKRRPAANTLQTERSALTQRSR